MKLGGSLFFPSKEDLYERLFGKRKGFRLRFHSERREVHGSMVQTKKAAQAAEAKRREELKNPKPETDQRPIDITFLELVNFRLDHVKAYNADSHYETYVYMARGWIKKWGNLSCSGVTQRMIQEFVFWRGAGYPPIRPIGNCGIFVPPSISD